MLRTLFRMKPTSTYTNEIVKIGDTFIENIQYPPCITCKHFSLYVPIGYDSHNNTKADVYESKCKKFGYMDIIRGDIKYESAFDARWNTNMCKIEGIYHEKKENN